MTEPQSPALSSERVFRFISDPEHKENLSGRVQAACMTCRRKKIKCSGEINCATCQEKGLVCEGLPERKRPRRESSSVDSENVGAPVRRLNTIKKSGPSNGPVSQLRSSSSTKSSDTGHGNNRRASTGTLLRPWKTSPKVSPAMAQSSLPKPAPTPFRVDTWEFGSSKGSGKQPRSESRNTPRLSTEQSPIKSETTTPPPHISATAAEWANHLTSDISWWQPDPPTEPSRLPESSPQLQSDAQSRSRHVLTPIPPLLPALSSNNNNNNINQSRRQTVQFPVPPVDNASRFDMLPNQPNIFDEMASLLAAGRTSRGGLTPGIAEYNPWWDMNGDLNAMLEQAGESLGSEQRQEQQQHQLHAGHDSAAQDVKIEEHMATRDGGLEGQRLVPNSLPSIFTTDTNRDHEEFSDTAAVRKASVGNFYW